MSYTNGILNHDDSQGLSKIGSRGLPGIGFKLDANNDYDMQNKKLVNVKQGTNNNDVVTKSQLDSEIAKIPSVDTTQFVAISGDTMTGSLVVPKDNYPVHGNLNKVISYESQREIFLSKKEGGRMEQHIDMNNNFITNVKDPVNSDHCVNKKYVENQLEKKLDKGSDIDMKNNSIINLDLPSNQRDAACVEFVNNRIDDMTQKKFLKVDGTNNMTGNLNLNEKTIINLNTDDKDIKSAANVGYVSSKVHTAKGDVTVGLKTYVDTKIKESHITSSTNKKDVFRYLMENADESSSENNIIVDGIVDFSGSPHNVNKKAYKFKMGKDAQNEYSSRIGFNMYKLPEGEYTLAIEFFPPSTTNLSVSVVSTSLNIGQQSTKLFVNYSRSIVHLHKWSITPPEYIYIDMHCQGTASSSTQGVGYLIVYGVKGSQSNVDSDVYDTAYIAENGKMVIQTNLDLNKNKIINLDLPSNPRDAACVEFVNNRINVMTRNTFIKVDGTNKMTRDLNLNNKRIVNLARAVNPNDALSKASLNLGISYLHARINRHKQAVFDDGQLLSLEDNIFIKSIVIQNTIGKARGSDKLIISLKNFGTPTYNFNYITGDITITINRVFSAGIRRIRLLKQNNLPILIKYLPVTFN